MATTIGDIANWAVTTVMNRVDLLDAAYGFAEDAYVAMCGKVPFEELSHTSSELPMTSGTATYSITSSNLLGIVSIRIKYSSSEARRLKRSHVRLYDGMGIVANGRPYSYARWGDSIEVMPPPDSSSYTYRIRTWSRPTLETAKAETELVTPREWDELLQWETLYRLYHATGEQEKAMMLMAPTQMPAYPNSPRKSRVYEFGIIPRLWNDLLRTYNQREAVDEDFSLNPSYRAYTSVKAGR